MSHFTVLNNVFGSDPGFERPKEYWRDFNTDLDWELTWNEFLTWDVYGSLCSCMPREISDVLVANQHRDPSGMLCSKSWNKSSVGRDKICLAKFEQNRQPKKKKQFCKQNGLSILSKKQNGQRMSFEFLDFMALATSC